MRRPSIVVVVLIALAAPAYAEAPERPTLLRIAEDGEREELPLVRGDARVVVRGPIAQVELTQVFANPADAPIEAVYVFPLPEDGAVGAMAMTIGARTIRADIRRRDEARAIYERARDRGRAAALLEQERPNVFTQSVANILPGEEIEVALTYDVLLAPADDVYELAIPTVVGPRYVPAGVVDADRVTPPGAAPGEPTGTTLALDVDLDAGLPIREVYSPTHTIVTARRDDARYQVTLAEDALVADKDFVLRWRVEVTSPALAVLAHKDAGAEVGHVALVLQPPAAAPDDPGPRELVFVVDTSGSMAGEPIALARRAMRYALERLDEDEAFRILVFADEVAGFEGGRLFPASPRNVRKALSWINGLDAGGGTEMIHAVREALSGPPDEGRTRFVCFLTDGYVANEEEILAVVDERRDPRSHLFSFGVGSSVNRYLLDGLAEHGGGVAHYLLLAEPPEPQIEAFYRQLETPMLAALTVTWDGVDVADAAPSRIRDLFAGEPIVVTGRYRRGGKATVRVAGTRDGRAVTLRLPILLPDDGGDGDVLARLWARRRIAELDATQVAGETPEVRDAITAIALEHALMSRYTSFVAVEERRRADGAPERVDVPVEAPQGVIADRTFEAVLGVAAGSQADGEIITITGSAPMIDTASTALGVTFGGASAVENRYVVDGTNTAALRGVERRWRGTVGLAAHLDHGAGAPAWSIAAGLERRLGDRTAAGLAATLWGRDDATLVTLLATFARWAIGDELDLRLGAGAARQVGDLGAAWQLRLAIPLDLLDAVQPELEVRLDGSFLLDEDLLAAGAGIGLRF